MATTVTTAATTAAAVIFNANAYEEPWSSAVVISNLTASAGSVFLGGSGVTATTGVEVKAGTSLVLPDANAGPIFAVATSTATVVVGTF